MHVMSMSNNDIWHQVIHFKHYAKDASYFNIHQSQLEIISFEIFYFIGPVTGDYAPDIDQMDNIKSTHVSGPSSSDH